MPNRFRTVVNRALHALGFEIVAANDPERSFHSGTYLRHDARRLEHLASLRIPVRGLTVLEVGAGIGDHSHYFLDRGCQLTITEARPENLDRLRGRYPGVSILPLDLERPTPLAGSPFDVVHCYGLLYHLSDPALALDYLAKSCRGMLLLETCVSFGETLEIHPVAEDRANPTQATSGRGCRPTRPWLFETLKRRFAHVYVPRTQPNHEEFPLDWTAPGLHAAPLARSVFIASRAPIENDALSTELLRVQTRHA